MKKLILCFVTFIACQLNLRAQCTCSIPFVGAAQAVGNGAGVTIAKPTGVAVGDLMIAAVHVGWCNSGSAITPPTGWTLINNTSNTGSGCGSVNTSIQMATFYKIAGASEPLNYSFAATSNQYYVGGIVAYSGCNTVTPIHVVSNNGAQSTCGSIAANGVTSSLGCARLISVFFCSVNSSVTNIIPQISLTERFDVGTTGNHPWGNENLELADELISIGSTGNRTAALSGCTSNGWVTGGQMIVITPSVIANSPTVTVNSGYICPSNSFTIVPTGASSYTIQGGNAVVSPNTNATYTVVGTGTNGCTSNAVTSTVNVITMSPLNVTPTFTICQNSNLNLSANASGATSYSWSNSAGPPFTSTSQNPVINNVSPGNAGNYSVTALFTNPNTTVVCQSSAVSNVSVVALNPVTPYSSANVCQYTTGTFSAVASGASGYQWFGPNGFTSSSQTNSITNIQPVSAGNYTVNAIFSIGTVSCLTTNSITLNVIPVGTIAVTPSIVVCEKQGANFTANAPNATSYMWSGPNNFTTNTQNLVFANLTSAMSGIYTVTVAFNSSPVCYHTNQTTLTVKPSPTLSVSNNSVFCSTQVPSQITLNVSGANTYSWSTNSTATSIIVSPVATTPFVVTGTYTNGCVDQATITISIVKCLGIFQVTDEHSNIFVYPNPNNGFFTIDLPYKSSIVITDLLGKLIYDKQLEQGRNNINLDNLINGIYLLRIEGGAGPKAIKFIKE